MCEMKSYFDDGHKKSVYMFQGLICFVREFSMDFICAVTSFSFIFMPFLSVILASAFCNAIFKLHSSVGLLICRSFKHFSNHFLGTMPCATARLGLCIMLRGGRIKENHCQAHTYFVAVIWMNWNLVRNVYSSYVTRLVGAILITLTYRWWLYGCVFFTSQSLSTVGQLFHRRLLSIHSQVLPVHRLQCLSVGAYVFIKKKNNI